MRSVEAETKNGADVPVAEISSLGHALSDPIRVRMLGMMAGGRECCELPECGAPATTEDTAQPGICVCEFVGCFGMSQSKISYHLRQLKDAGLVTETRRGKWRFYELRNAAVANALTNLKRYLGVG